MLNWIGARSALSRQVVTAGIVVTVLALACCPAAWAQPTLSPRDGTIGTQFTISGTGFGTEPGKVLFWPDNPVLKPPRINILSWTNTAILAVVGAAGATMECGVQVLPKGSTTPITSEQNFDIRRPNMDSLSPASGSVTTPVTISGEFFGTGMPRVYFVPQAIGVKALPCKVLAFSDSVVDILVPETAAPGTYHVWVINRVGADGKEDAFDVTPPP